MDIQNGSLLLTSDHNQKRKNMNTHADKTQENTNQSLINKVSQKQSGIDSTFQFIDNRQESRDQKILHEIYNNEAITQLKAIQMMINGPIVVQLNGEWQKFQKAVADGTVILEVSDKHIKGKPKQRRMERKNGRRAATGPYSNQSQERVIQNAIAAVEKGTARFISSEGTDFTIEVDSEHGKHAPRQFNIHKGGGGANTRYIHQIYGESSQFNTPDNAEYSDSESEADDD
ncbi:MAG: hypothetical protein JZU47_09310 [Prolixibacteraceae bacterium]|nr:hypothetical protein [Prolixibacteraceae bacterium]